MTMCEINVVFVENSGPLERSSWIVVRMNGRSLIIMYAGWEGRLTVKFLACMTVAVLRVQRLLSAQLVPDLPAMTASFVADMEVGLFMDSVRRSMLPGVELALSIPRVTIIAVSSVCRCFSHCACAGMEMYLIQSSEGSGCWTESACRGAVVD